MKYREADNGTATRSERPPEELLEEVTKHLRRAQFDSTAQGGRGAGALIGSIVMQKDVIRAGISFILQSRADRGVAGKYFVRRHRARSRDSRLKSDVAGGAGRGRGGRRRLADLHFLYKNCSIDFQWLRIQKVLRYLNNEGRRYPTAPTHPQRDEPALELDLALGALSSTSRTL
ncbi:hypothetical protein EVAR_14068_1 [Eumeta japonica]|uniref:Uncharacterized protein n=1 Tax=Eumeta variegata TaxID=151549 RepID=A0A4C1UNG7_EUMVA|nr:hypothetical protein EVAR_14068_1 [Eumeta japonica]